MNKLSKYFKSLTKTQQETGDTKAASRDLNKGQGGKSSPSFLASSGLKPSGKPFNESNVGQGLEGGFKNLHEKYKEKYANIQSYFNIGRIFKSMRVNNFITRRNSIQSRMDEAREKIKAYQKAVDAYDTSNIYDLDTLKKLHKLNLEINERLREIDNSINLWNYMPEDYQKGGIAKLWTWLTTPKGQQPDYRYEEVIGMQEGIKENLQELKIICLKLTKLKQTKEEDSFNRKQNEIESLNEEVQKRLDKVGEYLSFVVSSKE